MLAFEDVLNLLFFEHVEYASLGVIDSLLSRGLCRFLVGMSSGAYTAGSSPLCPEPRGGPLLYEFYNSFD